MGGARPRAAWKDSEARKERPVLELEARSNGQQADEIAETSHTRHEKSNGATWIDHVCEGFHEPAIGVPFASCC